MSKRVTVDAKLGVAVAVAVIVISGAVLGWAALTGKPKGPAVEPAPPQTERQAAS